MILTAVCRPFLTAQTLTGQYECMQTASTISFILGMPALWSRPRSCETHFTPVGRVCMMGEYVHCIHMYSLLSIISPH